MTNPKHSAFQRTYDETGDVGKAIAAYDAAATQPEPAPAEEPASILASNPHRRPGDPSLADWGALSVSEMDAYEAAHPGLSERILAAHAWEAKQAAGDWRAQEEAARGREHETIAADAGKTLAYLAEQDTRRFRQQFWSLAPHEREAEAKRLDIDLNTYTPPNHAYDS